MPLIKITNGMVAVDARAAINDAIDAIETNTTAISNIGSTGVPFWSSTQTLPESYDPGAPFQPLQVQESIWEAEGDADHIWATIKSKGSAGLT